MIRFLHLADTHIDYKPQLEKLDNINGIFEDRLVGIRQAISYAKENGIKLIIHAGDIFNTPSPKLNTIYELDKLFLEAEESGVEFLLISGNHDQSKIKAAFNALRLYELRKNVHVFTNDGIFTYNNVEFLCIPAKHDWSNLKQNFATSLKNLINQSKIKSKVLVSHIPLLNAKESATFDIESVSEEVIDPDAIPDIFSYVALGHFHSMQQIQNRQMYYSGSTSQLSFGEENENKYFLDVSIDDSGVITINPIEIMLIHKLHTLKVDASYVTNVTDFTKLLKHEIEVYNKSIPINGSIIRILINNLANNVRLNVDNDLILKMLNQYSPFGVKIHVSTNKESTNIDEEISNKKDLLLNPKDEVRNFLFKNNKLNSDIESLNEEIFGEFENKYNESNSDQNDY